MLDECYTKHSTSNLVAINDLIVNEEIVIIRAKGHEVNCFSEDTIVR